MGADFSYDIIKDKELKLSDREIESKSEEIFEQAAYNHGHAGYSGTLAEKGELGVTIHRESIQEDEEKAIDFVENSLDSDKWGPADVVPIKGIGWLVGGWCSA